MYLVAVLARPGPNWRRHIHVTVLVAAAACGSASAQWLGEPGTEAFPGLSIDASARSAGLAGAACALPEGTESLGDNPAGLVEDRGHAVYRGSVRAQPDGADAGAVAYAQPWGDRAQIAVGAGYLDYGSIQSLDELGNPTGATLRPMSFYPAATYAQRDGEHWRWGATFKMATEYLGDFEGSQAALGMGADVGVQYQPAARNLGFGASLVNVGKKIRGHFAGDADRGGFPTVANAGLFYHPIGQDKVTLTAQAELPFYDAPAAALGCEYRYSPQWTLRAGTRWDVNDVRNILVETGSVGGAPRYGSAMKAAAGTSLQVGAIGVDYALQWWVDLGFVHTLALSWAL